MRRWITFVAALLVGIAMGQLGAQPRPASDVRVLGVRHGGSPSPSEDLVRAVSQWTDDVARVRELLAQGADPNVTDDSARVPLSLAAVRDNRRIVRERHATWLARVWVNACATSTTARIRFTAARTPSASTAC
jgi:hypothetical protein